MHEEPSSTDATEPVCASGVPACRGWAPEPQLQAILLNPVPLSPSPLKIQNNGWVEREDPSAGSGEKVSGLSGSGPIVLCKPTRCLWREICLLCVMVTSGACSSSCLRPHSVRMQDPRVSLLRATKSVLSRTGASHALPSSQTRKAEDQNG